jgi:transcriptional regulator with XRE-family HTH domain
MNENKALLVARTSRRHLRAPEREQILALWAQSGLSAEEVAHRTGVSRSSLARWKRARSTPSGSVTAHAALVEVPAPLGGLGVAEVKTRGGAVRLFAAATPTWAAQLIRELNRC